MGPTEEAYDQKTPYLGVDHCCVEGRPSRCQCSGSVPEAWDLGCDVLYVADEIREAGSQRREKTTPTGRGKPAVDRDGGGTSTGPPGAEGNHRKNW